MFSFLRKTAPPFVSAVIVAAGAGSRMAGIDKQQALIDTIPVVVRSIMAFSECGRITEIIVVCRDGEIPDYYALCKDYGLDKVSSIVAGGKERQDSVFNGIRACNKDAAYFAVHDGARPLVTEDIIGECLDVAIEYGAAACGVPVKDTIKICTADGFIASTPNRAELFAIQTPQIFEAQSYLEAMRQAIGRHDLYTDDCQLMERAGKRVFISHGSYENMKITTPEDLDIAQAILSYREGGLEPWLE